MATPVNSADFDNVADEIGETVTIYAPSQTFSSDYDSVETSTLGDGSDETVIVQPAENAEFQRHHGRIEVGDAFMFFKAASVIANNSLVLVSATSKYYRVIFLEDLRPGGSTHHYEALMRIIK